MWHVQGPGNNNNNNNNNNIIYLTAIGLLPGGSGCIDVHIYEKGAKNLKPGVLHEKHAVATWSLGNRISICLQTQGNQAKPVSRWQVAGPVASSPSSNVYRAATHKIHMM